MSTIVTYTASLCTRRSDYSVNSKNGQACQEYYTNNYNYVGIIHFPGLNLTNKVINALIFDIKSDKAGYGASSAKTVYWRRSNYQEASKEGVTGADYVGTALGTITGSFYDNLTSHLNERGIKTKKGTSLWRGTSVRALIDNPIYIGIYHMNGAQSEPFDHLKIIDEDMFRRCQQTVKGRSTKNFGEESMVLRTDTRSLLTGIIYCGHCGCRLCYNHQHEERKLAGGGTSIYDYETYRCYRKISSKVTCDGQSAYKAKALNGAVEQQVKLFLSKIQSVPKERLVELASARNEETYKIAYKQAEKDFQNAQKQVTALEEEAVKALTGESQLDLSVVNSMLVKHRAKLETAQRAMEDARTRMEAEKENAAATKAQIDELLSWAECFEAADIGTKHLIVARLIERVEVKTGYKVHIKFIISIDLTDFRI